MSSLRFSRLCGLLGSGFWLRLRRAMALQCYPTESLRAAKIFLDCGGKRSATPLWDRQQPWPSGVALRFPPQSKTLWWRLRRAMALR
jgi:hypothetical protein